MKTRYGAPVAGTEKEVLGGFLDHYRHTLFDICEGLSEEQLRRPMVPSGTSLLGIVQHLAFVERGWFQENVANEGFDYPFDTGDPEAEFRIEDGETGDDIFELTGKRVPARGERWRRCRSTTWCSTPIAAPTTTSDGWWCK